jgi:hypothetical protein
MRLLSRTLPISERLTMIPWLFAVLDFESTPETYKRCDEMSAKDMFKMYGVSRAMYEGFIKPTLLVALFAPPEVPSRLLFEHNPCFCALMLLTWGNIVIQCMLAAQTQGTCLRRTSSLCTIILHIKNSIDIKPM